MCKQDAFRTPIPKKKIEQALKAYAREPPVITLDSDEDFEFNFTEAFVKLEVAEDQEMEPPSQQNDEPVPMEDVVQAQDAPSAANSTLQQQPDGVIDTNMEQQVQHDGQPISSTTNAIAAPPALQRPVAVVQALTPSPEPPAVAPALDLYDPDNLDYDEDALLGANVMVGAAITVNMSYSDAEAVLDEMQAEDESL
jgi:hypothetical protein